MIWKKSELSYFHMPSFFFFFQIKILVIWLNETHFERVFKKKKEINEVFTPLYTIYVFHKFLSYEEI